MSPLSRCLSIVVLVAAAPLASADGPFVFANTPGALPKDVIPIEYRVHVVPDLAARTFRGRQSVRIEVLRPTGQIVMNGLNLELVGPASLRGPGRARVALAAPRLDKERQQLVFSLPRVIARGRYTLDMAWTGVINGTAQGLHADRYLSPAGERVLLATEMEPANARRLLPCWDEPSFRARFRLSVDLPPGFSGYSNMPLARSEALADGGRRLAFAPTPKMASYLLALVAGELERLGGAIDGTRVGVVTTAGKLGSAPFALAASRQLLRYYNGYFGLRYPLPKLDQIAIPGGFGGAMENWGAIVFNEPRLLIDPKNSPEAARQDVYNLAAHEIAHQWFGNLVTMAWWDTLWLNEAFAQWMGNKASDRFHPQWHVWLDANQGREFAMDLDARASTHPIEQPVVTESEAESAFDAITYQKGASFLRMLEAWLGEAPFRAGIRAYLGRHRYSNTTGDDLWAALARASGKPVAAFAAAWTLQPGFPLVSVEARCEAGQRRVALRQEQFRLGDGEAGTGRVWQVPIRIGGVGGAPVFETLLTARSAELAIAGCDGPLLLDPDNLGFYRVRYAPPLFDALVARWSSLPDGARLKLLADTGALLRAGELPLASHLALLPRLRDEPRLAIWVRLVSELRIVDRLLVGETARPAWHRFAASLIAPRFARLGWDERSGESNEDRQLRGVLASALSDYDDPATIEAGRARFARFLEDRSSLPASLAEAVLEIAGRHADRATWDALVALAERAPSSEERFRTYRALARARDPALAERTLQLSVAPEVPQIIRNELAAQVARSDHMKAAWTYGREHADALLADLTQYAGGRYFAGIARTSADSALADELEAFAEARLPAGAQLDARRAGDEIRTRGRLKARLLPQLEAALPQ
ncbi:MAG: M1 family metallopeptidase [Caldimonas sp.]